MASINASADTPVAAMAARSMSRAGNAVALGALVLLCAVALFVKLGAPALFEPDEGRNAEKAREILLLNDWVTPHENILVVLDKPIFYYWLVAASYRTFGVSEWSARLPSALAAGGSVALVFFFALRFFGFWPALWSSLILVTSLEFCVLGRIVIFDMTLTFFTTLALLSFFCALHEEPGVPRISWLGLMYFSVGIATLVKGPIGVILPGMVALGYLLIGRKLALLRGLGLYFGIPFFLAIVVPWYYEVDRLNPGYLRYFLWEENFIRYLTPHFNRSEGWYYFLMVLAVGFLPWTVCIPGAVRNAWRARRDDSQLFLLCWTVLPFLFFSFSRAKLPHYILPIFPPLALLVGISLEHKIRAAGKERVWLLVLSCFSLGLLLASLLIAAAVPQLFRGPAQSAFAEMTLPLRVLALLAMIAAAALGVFAWTARWKSQIPLFVGLTFALVLYLNLLPSVLIGSSMGRSARDLAAKASPYVQPNTQVVIYDTTLEGLPFYLGISQPIWIVWSGQKASVMGSFYLAEEGAQSAPGFGQVLLSFEEFDAQWASAPKNHFAVFIKRKNLLRLEQATAHRAKILIDDGGMLLVSN
ncbi:MAG TPA: glycosyltransferase family 39 protein [Terriglobales bacterium]|nr:glycosyltransferase family 39 protein [Terriglobales bacterium]